MRIKYKYIIFDFDDTLFDYNRSEEFALKSALQTVGIDYSSEKMMHFREINRKLWNSPNKPKKTDEFYLLRSTIFLNDLSIFENEIIDKFNEEYLIGITTPFYTENAYRVVETLRNFCSIYIASNGPREVRCKKLLKSGLNGFIDGFYSSENIGFSKPDIRFYESILSSIGAEKNDILFVGDTYTTDVEGAVNFGCDVAWLTKGVVKTEANVYLIRNLVDLLDIVLECDETDVYGVEDNIEKLIKESFRSVERIELIPHGKSTFVYDVSLEGKEYIFKFPRTSFAAVSLVREIQNSICIESRISVAVPHIMCEFYNNRFFAYYKKIDGINLSDALELKKLSPNLETTAKNVANIIYEISQISLDKMPSNIQFKSENISEFTSDFAPTLDLTLIEQLENDGISLIHGDFHRSNTLINELGEVVAVLDLATFSKGNPLFDVYGYVFSMGKYSPVFVNTLENEIKILGFNVLEDQKRNIVSFLDRMINQLYLPFVKSNNK